jgi:hypothetical protein
MRSAPHIEKESKTGASLVRPSGNLHFAKISVLQQNKNAAGLHPLNESLN